MKVHELLNKKDKWARYYVALTKTGEICKDENDPSAHSFCLLGALSKCYPDNVIFEEKLRSLEDYLATKNLGLWNDTKGYEEVVRICKKLNI